MTLDTLMTRYDVDTAHARHVADLALTLFDATKDIHGLPSRMRQLLEVGALLHNVGLHIDQPLHHIIGRDIVLDVSLPELDAEEQAIVACLVAFHRKKVHPEFEPAYLRLRKKDQQHALRLAAMLRIADGLDYSESQTTQIRACTATASQVTLHLCGVQSAENGERALKKADLWRKVLQRELAIALDTASSATEEQPVAPGAIAELPSTPAPDGMAEAESPPGDETQEATIMPVSDGAGVAEPDHPADTPEQPVAYHPEHGNGVAVAVAPLPVQAPPPSPATVSPYDTLADVGRRALRSNFQKLLEQEDGVRDGKDPEAVHDMRVATRRLRAILQIIHDIAPAKEVRYFRKELQYLAQTLSPVRDGDVFLQQVADYIAALPEFTRTEALVLPEAIKRDRAAGRATMLAYLDSPRAADLKRDFAMFITDRPKNWHTTVRVRDLAGSHIWRRYEELRAHEVHINLHGDLSSQSEELHEMRIAGKRLRYVLEMYAEPLGPDTRRCLKPLMAVQEHLGSLQDIAVAVAYVRALEVSGAARNAMEAYIAAREAERAQLFADLPECWEQVMGETYRRDLAGLIAGL